MTVLFCDIVNSTGLAERVGAEAMHALLNHFFELALAQVHRYEGTINQFLGDGFMALFGAPVAHEDHARRAVPATLGIQRTLRERAADLGGEEAGLAVPMGLNTGPVIVGKVGDNLRMDYTAVGGTTNLAARLQQHAEPGTILIDHSHGCPCRSPGGSGLLGAVSSLCRPLGGYFAGESPHLAQTCYAPKCRASLEPTGIWAHLSSLE